MKKDEFESEYNKIFERAMTLGDKTRREGLLSLEECINEELLNKMDVMETGLRLACDGTDRTIIDNILTNIINQETDSDKKLLKTVQKTAVLLIHEGYSAGLLELTINSLVDIGYENALKVYLESKSRGKALSEDNSTDFYSQDYPDKCTKNELKAISILHEKFVRLAIKSLSVKLNCLVKMFVASIDQYTIKDFIRTLPDSATIGIINMQPLNGCAAMEIYNSIAFDGIFPLLLEDLRQTWSEVINLQPKLEKTETSPKSIKIAPHTEGAIVLTFETTIDETEAMINFAIPYSVIKPVLNQFTEEKFNKVKKEIEADDAEECRKAAENGDAAKQLKLAYCYLNGEGVEQDYEKCVEWLEKSASQGNTEALYYLGICYKNGKGVERNVNKALEIFYKALESMNQNDLDENSTASGIYNEMAFCYNELGEYQKAINYCEKALVIQKKIMKEDFPETGDIYYNLGVSYFCLEQYETAIENFNKGITVKEAFQGKETFDAAVSYLYIAGCYEAIKDYDKALDFYNEALIIYEKISGKDHLDTALTYFCIADCYYKKQDFKKAVENDLMALKIREKICEENDPLLSLSYNNIGSNYRALGNYEEALKHHLKALELRKKYCDIKEYIAFSYTNAGKDYESLGDKKNALKFFKESLLIYESLDGVEKDAEEVRQAVKRVSGD